MYYIHTTSTDLLSGSNRIARVGQQNPMQGFRAQFKRGACSTVGPSQELEILALEDVLQGFQDIVELDRARLVGGSVAGEQLKVLALEDARDILEDAAEAKCPGLVGRVVAREHL